MSFISVSVEIAGTPGDNFLDYEEGTWTPDLRFGAGVTGITYTSRTGKFTKRGNLVTIAWDINLSSKGTDTGQASIYSLPHTSFSIVGQVAPVGFQSGMTAAITFMNRIEDSNNIITLSKPSGTGVTPVLDTDFTNTTRIAGSTTYIIE